MISYFYEYIRKVILFLIFTSLMQVIVPTSKYKSYINLVFGILLIFIMLEPIKNIYENLDEITVFNEQEYSYDNYKVDENQYKDIQNEMVMELFEENIKKQMERALAGYSIKDISLKIKEDNFKTIHIKEIYLVLSRLENSVYVRPFNKNNVENNQSKEINEIKKLILQVYNLEEDNIFITIT